MQRLHLAVMLLFGLAGTGGASASPKILLDPNPLNFFELVVGSSGSLSYNVANAGKTQLVVMDMQIAGPDADQFHFDGETAPFCGSGHNISRLVTKSHVVRCQEHTQLGFGRIS